jgi:uncharacterized protein YaeQ
MALKSTIFKATLSVADMDRGYYGDHELRLARHPSETDERLMVRLLAFALHADPALAFGRGIATDDEPALWRRDLTGAITDWIEVGLPDPRAVRKACGRSPRVEVITYGSGANLWWSRAQGELAALPALSVVQIPLAASQALAGLAERSLALQCTIQEGHLWVSAGDVTLELEPLRLQTPTR